MEESRTASIKGPAQRRDSERRSCRRELLKTLLATSAWGLLGRAYAQSVDSIPLGPGEKVLARSTVVVPGRTDRAGVSGSDIYVPQRGWLTVAFAVESNQELTLMVLTSEQKMQISSGQRLLGDPMARILIQGPETAAQTVPLDSGGNLFVAFVNSDAKSVQVAYRTSFKAF